MIIHEEKSGLKVRAHDLITLKGTVKGHCYVGEGPNTIDKTPQFWAGGINFQNGTIPECGINGFTNESLLAILIHRTKHLDSLFPSEENKHAITAMEEALKQFNLRTTKRINRGVEGKHEV